MTMINAQQGRIGTYIAGAEETKTHREEVHAASVVRVPGENRNIRSTFKIWYLQEYTHM